MITAQLNATFAALADPTRRAMLAHLVQHRRNGIGAAATGLRPVVDLMYVGFFGV